MCSWVGLRALHINVCCWYFSINEWIQFFPKWTENKIKHFDFWQTLGLESPFFDYKITERNNINKNNHNATLLNKHWKIRFILVLSKYYLWSSNFLDLGCKNKANVRLYMENSSHKILLISLPLEKRSKSNTYMLVPESKLV